jgi:membrane protease YdiL (CAAX protease family)
MSESDRTMMTRKDERTTRRRFTKTALWGVPWFLIMNVAVLTVAVIVWLLLQKLFNVPFMSFDAKSSTPVVFHDYPRVILIMTLIGFLAYPLIFLLPSTRWAHRVIGGYGVKTLTSRMHVDDSKKPLAWLKASGIGIGIGLLIVGITTGLSLLSRSLANSQGAGDTTTGISAAAANAVLHWDSPYLVECILLVLFVFFIAPILEEILFRGIIGMSMKESGLFRHFGKTTRMILVCLVSGMLFGVLHAQFSSSVGISLMTMFQTTIIGMIFTWLAVYKYDSIVPTIFAHMTNNILSIVILIMLGV